MGSVSGVSGERAGPQTNHKSGPRRCWGKRSELRVRKNGRIHLRGSDECKGVRRSENRKRRPGILENY